MPPLPTSPILERVEKHSAHSFCTIATHDQKQVLIEHEQHGRLGPQRGNGQVSFFGASAGLSDTTGGANSFFGTEAGKLNTTGDFNSFFGDGAGVSNTTADSNSFFGFHAGLLNTGGSNSFFGAETGKSNETGGFNSFFGQNAGRNNNTGSGNAFFGTSAGFNNTVGQLNAFFGEGTGSANTTGTGNTFIGRDADFNMPGATGDNNTLLGSDTRIITGLSNATAIGARAHVTQSNSLVLGSISGVNSAVASTSVGIGTTAPKATLDVTGGNIFVGSPGQGIILKSPNGATCRLLSIDNAGNMTLAAVACP